MKVGDLITLYDYSYWANRQLMASLDRLTEEEFIRIIGGGHNSIRETLVHMMSAEWGWLGRCGGPPRGPRLNPADFPTIHSVRQTWETIEGHVRLFLDSLSDGDLQRTVSYRNDRDEELTMRLGELMHHAANHGVHHRGQISLMLRMLGKPPKDIDLLIYFAEKRGVVGW